MGLTSVGVTGKSSLSGLGSTVAEIKKAWTCRPRAGLFPDMSQGCFGPPGESYDLSFFLTLSLNCRVLRRGSRKERAERN